MTDDIIKMKLKEVGLEYKLTPRYFQIQREINMESKEPVWFKSFRIKQESFNQEMISFKENVIKRLDNLDNKVSKLEDYHK